MAGDQHQAVEKPEGNRTAWWRRPATMLFTFFGGVAVAAGGAFGSGAGEKLFSATTGSHSGLQFKIKDSSVDYSIGDLSYVTPGLAAPLTSKSPQGGTKFPPGATKAGTKDLTLTVSNGSDRAATLSDVRLVNLKVLPPVSGTLFSAGPQGEASNDLLGVDLSQQPPVLRHVTAVNGKLGDPYFSDTHISIAPHGTEVLVITVYAGGAHSYTWDLQVDYDTGDGERTATPAAPGGVLSITGYTHSYRRAYQGGSGGWESKPPSNFCRVTGTYCYGN